MSTEAGSPRYHDLDTWPTRDLVDAISDRSLGAAAAVSARSVTLATAIDAAAARLEDPQGRLCYAGAGASGRLGAQDGIELAPTFDWPDARLVLLLAGGREAMWRSIEGAEDDALAARHEIGELALGEADVVIGVAASGSTPYTVAAIDAARAAGALTIGIANNDAGPLLDAAEHAIALETGAEVIAGSTRMAAGTAQKIALNILSTGIMTRLGRVHGNLMVNLASRNRKLDRRRIAILARIAAVAPARAEAALNEAGGDIKRAALRLRGLSADEADARLAAAGGNLRRVLEALEDDPAGR